MATANSLILAQIDTAQLIEDIRNRPAIWNRDFQCGKTLLDDTWNDLSKFHGCTVLQLKQKWKGLRDAFRIEMKRIPKNAYGQFIVSLEDHATKWKWFKLMTFLISHMRRRIEGTDSVTETPYFLGFSDETMFAAPETMVEITEDQYTYENETVEVHDEVEDIENETVDLKASVIELIGSTGAIVSPSTSSLPPPLVRPVDVQQLSVMHHTVAQHVVPHVIPSLLMVPERTVPQLEPIAPPPLVTSFRNTFQSPSSNLSGSSGSGAQGIVHSTIHLDNIQVLPAIPTTSRWNTLSEPQVETNNNQTNMRLRERSQTPQLSERPNSSSKGYNLPKVTVNLTKLNIQATTEIGTRRRSCRLTSTATVPDAPRAPLKEQSVPTRARTSTPLTNSTHGRTPSNDRIISSSKRKRSVDLRQSDTNSVTYSEPVSRVATSTNNTMIQTVATDDDHHFLMSLHPYMRELSAAQKLKMRMKIQRLIFKELYKKDEDNNQN